MKVAIWLLFGALLCLVQHPAYAQNDDPNIVLINRPYSTTDTRYRYPQELLQLALDKVAGLYGRKVVRCSPYTMSRDRIFRELQRGDLVQVMAEAPKPHWEEQLIPIRIPIRKGIQGYRVFLIKKRNEQRMSKVQTLADLEAMPTGSGAQWSTAAVMADAGFNVVSGSNYEGLFQMLEEGRFVTFGRGINEAYQELDAHRERFPDFRVDTRVLLYIPLPTYFFVTPQRPALARQIEAGLRAMLADGSFDRLFYAYFGKDIERAQLENRKVFAIPNPNLSDATPFDDKGLWFDPRTDWGALTQALQRPQPLPAGYTPDNNACAYDAPMSSAK